MFDKISRLNFLILFPVTNLLLIKLIIKHIDRSRKYFPTLTIAFAHISLSQLFTSLSTQFILILNNNIVII